MRRVKRKEPHMARNGKSSHQLQEFVKDQIHEAQKRWHGLETEAGKVLKNLVSRGQKSRKELGGLLHKLNARDINLLENPTVKQLGKQANRATVAVRKRMDHLQARVLEVSGVASQTQVKEINKEINRLAKRVDSLLGKKGASPEMPS
jgi:polyhydroxyalkanoate synthesis regulator phasin